MNKEIFFTVLYTLKHVFFSTRFIVNSLDKLDVYIMKKMAFFTDISISTPVHMQAGINGISPTTIFLDRKSKGDTSTTKAFDANNSIGMKISVIMSLTMYVMRN